MADEKAIIAEAQQEAQYDDTAKTFLAQKPFLANILVRTVKEFMGMDPLAVENLIEGEPHVGSIPVEHGFTNSPKITGMNNESKVKYEGIRYYDVIFYVRTADGLSKIIINIEAQKSEPTQYDVEMRGLYYAIREISSQLDREFSGQNYNDIKKVYSIWICMNESKNTLEKIYLTKQDLIGASRWKEMYELVNVVIIRLAKQMDEEKEHELHRLLGAMFLPELNIDEKNNVLENEFKIQMEGERKELLKSMCNLSQGIKEQALEKGIEQGREQGLEQGRELEVFASVQEGDYGVARGAQKLELSVEEFKKKMISAGYRIPSEI